MSQPVNSFSGTIVCFVNRSGTAQELYNKLNDKVKDLVVEIGNNRLEIALPNSTNIGVDNYRPLFKELDGLEVYQVAMLDDRYHMFFKRDLVNGLLARADEQNRNLAAKTFK